MLASPTDPIPLAKREYQLKLMRDALDNFERAPQPTHEDWSALATAVDLMETLRDAGHINDEGNTLNDAVAALGKSGMRSLNGSSLRLDGPAIGLLRGIIEDYEMVCEALPARIMIAAHRTTEKRITKKVSA
jgi:hypothetical protein